MMEYQNTKMQNSLPRRKIPSGTIGGYEICKTCDIKVWPGEYVTYSDDTINCKECHAEKKRKI